MDNAALLYPRCLRKSPEPFGSSTACLSSRVSMAPGCGLIDDRDVHVRDWMRIPVLPTQVGRTPASLPAVFHSPRPRLTSRDQATSLCGRKAIHHPCLCSCTPWHACFHSTCAILCHWSGMFHASPPIRYFNGVFCPLFFFFLFFFFFCQQWFKMYTEIICRKIFFFTQLFMFEILQVQSLIVYFIVHVRTIAVPKKIRCFVSSESRYCVIKFGAFPVQRMPQDDPLHAGPGPSNASAPQRQAEQRRPWCVSWQGFICVSVD